ncbi:MAG: hypothetical protein ACOYEV_03560 [Candidatus Nanopelagicales bacterium]
MAALAAAAVFGVGSAYTASISLPPTILGYGSVVVEGVNVVQAAYEQDAGHTKLLSVEFTALGDVSDAAGYSSLMKASAVPPVTCGGVYSAALSRTTITCQLPADTPVGAGAEVQLTVVHGG